VNAMDTLAPVFTPLPTTPDGWLCVLADPPWAFNTWSVKGQSRAPSQHYHTLSIDTILTLPLTQILARDAWLFLWLPDVHVPRLTEVMGVWGFEFSGKAFTWVKTTRSLAERPRWISTDEIDRVLHMGLGKTTRKNSESCWLGRRGKPKILSHTVREIIIAPGRSHSRKPSQTYMRVEALCDGPRLDLFGRQSRPGWTIYGDQATKFDAPLVDPPVPQVMSGRAQGGGEPPYDDGEGLLS
jgi:N6-adenosine-specific RNA methylase IME4